MTSEDKRETSRKAKAEEAVTAEAPRDPEVKAIEDSILHPDPYLGERLAKPDAYSEPPELAEDTPMLHCGNCRNLALIQVDRIDWVVCPRCGRQPSAEAINA